MIIEANVKWVKSLQLTVAAGCVASAVVLVNLGLSFAEDLTLDDIVETTDSL